MHAFTLAFLAALLLVTATRVWLALRHIRHVSAHRERVPPEFAGSVPLAAHQKAADYTRARTRLGILDALVSAAVLLGFTLGGGLEWLYDVWARAFEAGGYAHGIALILSVAAITGLIDLPFSIYRTFVIEAKFGFNRMTPALFVADLAKSIALGLAIGVPPPRGAVADGADGRSLVLYVWLTWVGFNLLMLVAYPTLIAPLFNKFSPLADETLKERIERLLAKCGFRSKGLFVMDGSKRSSHGNAYFTGFGAAKRIVFFDTLLARLAPSGSRRCSPSSATSRHLEAGGGYFSRASVPGAARLRHQRAPVLRGARRRPASTAVALVLFMVVPVFTFLLAPIGASTAQACTGRRVRRELRERRGPRPRAGEARPGQRGDADAGPGAFGLLRLAPAGRAADRAPAGARALTGRAGSLAGQIVAAYGRRLLVEAAGGELVACVPRGRQASYACGDRVFVARPPGRGLIEASDPRSTLFRAAPHRRKLIAANATQVAAITAGEPSVSEELVARILIAAGSQGMRATIVLNKADLAAAASAPRARLAPFAQAGYLIVELSAHRDVASLRATLAGETTVLIGQSGMGKSTIVNALLPGTDAATREISRFLDSGRHTTSATRLYRLDDRSVIIDSPGVEAFGLAHLSRPEIERGFPEIASLAGRCRFGDCRHRTEPGCAVRAAVASGAIPARRLELLLRILDAEGATR
jgi:STE24 endopeptidase